MQIKSLPKLKRNPWSDDHPEKLNDSGKSYGITQQLKGLFDPAAMLDSFIGNKKRSSEYRPFPHKERPQPRQENLVFSYQGRKEERQLKDEIKVLHEQLIKSVTQLEKSEKALVSEIAKVKVEQLPAKGGIYYLRYIEWLIKVVQQLRIKVDEGRTWLQTFSTRNKKRMGYWKMYKKHGTTFGMSHERTVATQTG